MKRCVGLGFCVVLLSGCGLLESEVSINRPLDNQQTTKDQTVDVDMFVDMSLDMPDTPDMSLKDMSSSIDMPVVHDDMSPVDMSVDIPPVEDMPMDTPPDMPVDPPVPPSDPVEQVVNKGCTTTIVKGLSQQLIDEMNCIQPGVMRSIAHVPELQFRSAVFPVLQDPASRSLEQLVKGQSMLTLSSALRTLPQQYLLYRWYQQGRCSIGLAAKPGRSNHNGGLAVDTPNYSAWKSRFNSNSWSWLGTSDPVHFNFSGGQDIRNLSVLALQRLWNRNNPGDKIAEDGAYGPQTEARMQKSPSMGFAKGPSCAAAGLVDGRDALMSLSWDGDLSKIKRVQTIAPAAVIWVEYTWNGRLLSALGRTSTTADNDRVMTNFELESMPKGDGTLLATGYDAEGRILGQAIAQRTTLKNNISLLWRAEGAGLYRADVIGAPAWLDTVGVRLNGELLRDQSEDAARTRTHCIVSTRPWRGRQVVQVSLADESGQVRERFKVPVLVE